MKRLITLLAACVCMAGYSQTADNTELKQHIVEFTQHVETNRCLTFAVSPIYAPDIVVDGKKDVFGLGLEVLTPATVIPSLSESAVAAHAYGGLRFDYLAHQAFASTIALGVKGDFQLWGHNFTLFGQSGATIPVSGFGIKNGEGGALVGTGVYTEISKFGKPDANGNKPGSFALQVSVEKRTQFPGMQYLGGPVVSYGW